MTKILLIVACGLVGTAMLAGDGLAAWLLLTQSRSGHSALAARVARPVERAHGVLHFAALDKFVVTLPGAGGDAPSYAQVGLSFSSYDQTALKAFDDVRPMIKAAVIATIMAHAGKVVTGSPGARQMIIAEALAAANSIVAQQDPKVGPQPFVGAFLTDFLLQ
jgi:flagellar basal body-associated protein FliL